MSTKKDACVSTMVDPGVRKLFKLFPECFKSSHKSIQGGFGSIQVNSKPKRTHEHKDCKHLVLKKQHLNCENFDTISPKSENPFLPADHGRNPGNTPLRTRRRHKDRAVTKSVDLYTSRRGKEDGLVLLGQVPKEWERVLVPGETIRYPDPAVTLKARQEDSGLVLDNCKEAVMAQNKRISDAILNAKKLALRRRKSFNNESRLTKECEGYVMLTMNTKLRAIDRYVYTKIIMRQLLQRKGAVPRSERDSADAENT